MLLTIIISVIEVYRVRYSDNAEFHSTKYNSAVIRKVCGRFLFKTLSLIVHADWARLCNGLSNNYRFPPTDKQVQLLQMYILGEWGNGKGFLLLEIPY